MAGILKLWLEQMLDRIFKSNMYSDTCGTITLNTKDISRFSELVMRSTDMHDRNERDIKRHSYEELQIPRAGMRKRVAKPRSLELELHFDRWGCGKSMINTIALSCCQF